MLRALIHHWRLHLAVLAAVAVNTAVLSGALMVGDSVRGSLRDMTLERLGEIDHALVAERFFRRQLADELAGREGFDASFDAAVPLVLLRGTAVHGDSGARATDVTVLGVDDGFAGLYGTPDALDLSRRAGQIFPSVIVNEALQRQLGVEVGDPVLVHFRLGSDVPRDTLLGSKDPEDSIGTMRLTLADVLPDEGPGRFGLAAHQTFPLNAWVEMGRLQRAVEQEGGVNALLLSRRGGVDPGDPAAVGGDEAGRVVEGALTLEDLGLTVAPTRGSPASPEMPASRMAVASREFVLRPAVLEAVERVAASLGAPLLRIQTYLANRMEVDGRTVPYSTVSALGFDDPAAAPRLRLVDGGEAPQPGPDGILLNDWAARELAASPGDRLQMSYYLVGPHEELLGGSHEFEVEGVVAMEGLAADPDLTPDYPGIEGADSIAAWDPPFPVDLDAVGDRDEAYWDEHGATPKAFVAEETARRLWSTRYGSVTSARVTVPDGRDAEAFAGELRRRLEEELGFAEMGFRLMNVKADGLEAAAGATDFGGLFIGFSFFLIVSAALLAGLLFSLGVERRAPEIGLRLAVGFPVRRVRRQMLAEGGVLAAAGAVVGLAGGVAYARALMAGLRTLWVDAVGTSRLFLHVEPVSLAAGGALSVAVVLVAIWVTVRRLGKVPATVLLRGSVFASSRGGGRGGRWSGPVAAVAGALGVVLLGVAVGTGRSESPVLALGAGAALLVAGLAAFGRWTRRPRGGGLVGSGGSVWSLAARNGAWNPGRSLLSVALVASACFVIVTVAANHRDPAAESETVEAGGGGYELVATSAVPLFHDLERPGARAELGFPSDTEPLLDGVDVTALRTLPGDDASCLNLYRPQRPTILGVPAEQIERGGFRFSATIRDTDDPWELLTEDLGEGVVPAFGDANSVQWILKLGLGEEITMEDQEGETVRLRLVGLLSESIFQSEILIAEEAFLRHFPDQEGYRTFLVDTPEGRGDEVARTLESHLADQGFDAVSTAAKVAGFLVVQNTYLSTFQMLGGLGLLLGTVGLAIVLVRNVIERRAELATLRAFGFRRRRITTMILAENAVLLLAGIGIGAGSALLAVTPRALAGAIELPLPSLLATLTLVVAVGTAASALAVVGALRVPLLPVLKAGN